MGCGAREDAGLEQCDVLADRVLEDAGRFLRHARSADMWCTAREDAGLEQCRFQFDMH